MTSTPNPIIRGKGRRLRQYCGVIHVHTDRSDGNGTLEEVVLAAKGCGVDFVVLTDHHTRGYGAENLEGWHEGVLVLAGEEVATPQGHALAFETREDVGEVATLEAGLEDIRRQVGVSVAVHQQFGYPPLRGVAGRAPVTDMAHTDMAEIWCFHDEFLRAVNGRTILQQWARPDKTIIGPSRKLLNRWDRELGRRRYPVVGGLNAHQRKDPLLDWKMFFPYGTSFATLQTIINCPDLPAVALRARDMVWEALREGRSFIANQSINDARGFEFEWHSGAGRTVPMGAQSQYEPGGRISVRVPVEAEVAIRCNGQPLFWGTGNHFFFPAPTPGSYRVEVRLNRRLWILSNAIRLVIDDKPIQPTVSDFT
jgi:hypothetical protein